MNVMQKKILVIDGHPYDKSFCSALAQAYLENSRSRADIQLLPLRDLKFDPILWAGYKEKQELEPDLQKAQELMKWADHLVIICPIWWGGPPALLKGFMDRTFLPGFAFKYRKGSRMWDKFMTGRSAHVIVTSDAPTWWMRWFRGDSTVKMIKSATLDFVGYSPVKVTRVGDIKWLSVEQRQRILNKIGW